MLVFYRNTNLGVSITPKEYLIRSLTADSIMLNLRTLSSQLQCGQLIISMGKYGENQDIINTILLKLVILFADFNESCIFYLCVTN